MSTEAKLPDLPSALIRVALADLAKVEAMPDKYEVNMGRWHTEEYGDHRCAVCVAGSVMAMSLGVGRDISISPSYFPDEDTRGKLFALDCFRCGDVSGALAQMGRPDLTTEFDRDVTEYEDNPTAFHSDMEPLAFDLEAAGL